MKHLDQIPAAERPAILAEALRRATQEADGLRAQLNKTATAAAPLDVQSIATRYEQQEWLPALHRDRLELAADLGKASAALARAGQALATASNTDWLKASLAHASAGRAVRDAAIIEQLHASAAEHKAAIHDVVEQLAQRRETAAQVARTALPDLQRRLEAAQARAENLTLMVSDIEAEEGTRREQLVSQLAGGAA